MENRFSALIEILHESRLSRYHRNLEAFLLSQWCQRNDASPSENLKANLLKIMVIRDCLGYSYVKLDSHYSTDKSFLQEEN